MTEQELIEAPQIETFDGFVVKAGENIEHEHPYGPAYWLISPRATYALYRQQGSSYLMFALSTKGYGGPITVRGYQIISDRFGKLEYYR